MARRRGRIAGWTYNDDRQELQAPNGRIITLGEITSNLADQWAGTCDINSSFRRTAGPRLSRQPRAASPNG